MLSGDFNSTSWYFDMGINVYEDVVSVIPYYYTCTYSSKIFYEISDQV